MACIGTGVCDIKRLYLRVSKSSRTLSPASPGRFTTAAIPLPVEFAWTNLEDGYETLGLLRLQSGHELAMMGELLNDTDR